MVAQQDEAVRIVGETPVLLATSQSELQANIEYKCVKQCLWS